MKKILLTSMLAVSVLLTGCYSRIGKLVIASTHNVDSHADYVLLQKDVTAKAKTKKDNCLELAVDKAIKDFPTGEFMKNVVFSVSKNGKKIRIVGDVWGYAPTTQTKKQ